MDLLSLIKRQGIRFFTGVPDSTLNSFCRSVCHDREVTHVTAACEGGAIAVAAGHWIATGHVPAVYMQNSGLPNALNPLMALVSEAAYDIPVLLLIGWRGQPGVPDEPQHRGIGRETLSLLRAAGIDPLILERPDPGAVKSYLETIIAGRGRGAMLISPACSAAGVSGTPDFGPDAGKQGLRRADVLVSVAAAAEKNCGLIVSGIGHTARELMALRETQGKSAFTDLPAVGGMGYASTLAVGIAMGGGARLVYCLDGDGAFLMHPGNQAMIGERPDIAFTHLLLDNGCHLSVGGQPVVNTRVDFPALARAIGYRYVTTVTTIDALDAALSKNARDKVATFVHVPVTTTVQSSLPRPSQALAEGLAQFRQLHGLPVRVHEEQLADRSRMAGPSRVQGPGAARPAPLEG